jgi:hypothetical protein
MAIAANAVRRLALASSLVLVLLIALAPSPARAEPVVLTGEETALRVNIHTFLRIVNAGIQATAIPPARIEFGLNPTVYFPVRSGGAFDVPNSLAAYMHDGGLRMTKEDLTLDTTNLTINCTSLTGCRLLGTANQALPSEVATIESVEITDDEAGTITFKGIAIIPETTALALNTLFETDAFVAGAQLGEIISTLTYDVATEPDAYARPRGASPLRVSLVPAYEECIISNGDHAPPLDHPSCNPPAQSSAQLTVGTPDANGSPANSIASARFATTAGDPGTPEDEADVRISVRATDVRKRLDLSDYEGELQASVGLRLTDRNNSVLPPLFPDNEPGTVIDTTFAVAVPCAATAGAEGGTCAVETTVDAVSPGLVVEGDRAIWQLDQVQLFDGGPDGVAATLDNTLFAVQGIFVP